MAPVTATTTGIPHYPIDDPELSALIDQLRSYEIREDDDEDGTIHVDIEGLVGELERVTSWTFMEQTDLYEWTKPLDTMDAAIRKLSKDFPALFLIAPPDSNTNHNKTSDKDKVPKPAHQAESPSEVDSLPPSTIHALSTILRFLSLLLRNSYHKTVFNSIHELTALLASSSDTISSLSLQTLSSLALPSQAHRMNIPDTSQNGTVLHNSPCGLTHSRIMMLAKGWGGRGSGLGLKDCVSVDDSLSGQGELPVFAGEVRFEYLPPNQTTVNYVCLTSDDVCLRNNRAFALNVNDRERQRQNQGQVQMQVEKKRKVVESRILGGNGHGPASSETKSTSSLFFHCLKEQIRGREHISQQKLFELLVNIRLAKSFHSRKARIEGVENRLRALCTMLYSHPSNDVLAGYFLAQPELCVELTDLIRPTVSQSAISSDATATATLSSTSTNNNYNNNNDERKQAAVTSIIDPLSEIPYTTRILALEVLTALVGRKDDGTNGVPHIARQANVLAELGVAKGQYSGLLPTLIRYSLASLKSFVPNRSISDDDDMMIDAATTTISTTTATATGTQDVEMEDAQAEYEEDDFGLELGMAFVNVTRPRSSLQKDSEEKALEFISSVLSLSFAVVSVSNGTVALTDCGLIPVLVCAIALENKRKSIISATNKSNDGNDDKSMNFSQAMFKFVIAQSIQLLEGSITNHNQALSAFHELDGIEVLLTCLSAETKWIQSSEGSQVRNLLGPNRVLMYSVLNCLTVVFHLQETSSRSGSFSLKPGDVLQRKEMKELLIEIMDHVSMYGGILGSLAITFLGDTMNSDPRIVHYVYECGLSESFFGMLKSKSQSKFEIDSDKWHEPMIPASPELIAVLPTVITALALTDEGRKNILEVNPMPEILGILCCPDFAMPTSRCMSGDMASMIGSGLDELMRHVPSLKSSVIEAIVSFIKRVVFTGKKVVKDELDFEKNDNVKSDVQNSRIRFMHYAHNISQVLEQVLQNEEHCSAFADAGGVDALLQLHPFLMPSGTQFLAHISSQSSPSVAILSHSTTAITLTTAIKRIASNYSARKVLKKINEALSDSLTSLEESIKEVREVTKASNVQELCFDENDHQEFNTAGILEGVPRLPLHLQIESNPDKQMMVSVSTFLRNIVNIEWITLLLASILKMPISSEFGSRLRAEFHEDMSSEEFQLLLNKLSTLFRCSLYEVCRIRTEKDFNDRDQKRWNAPGDSNYHPALYRLRIVCAEGAVVRDGIDIDSCASVGGLEMGEEVDAFDRCVNGSGIMRYRTAKGWVSEQTRGHGREPISEVLKVSGIAPKRTVTLSNDPKTKGAIECGIPDLSTASASILARLQNSQCFLFTCLSRAVLNGFKSTSGGLLTPERPIKSFISKLTINISRFLRANFNMIKLSDRDGSPTTHLNKGGEAMYLGNMLNILHCCIYEEGREKQILNVLIFCNLLLHDGLTDAIFIPESISNEKKNDETVALKDLPTSGFYGAIRSVLEYGLEDMSSTLERNKIKSNTTTTITQSKVVASSFPPALSLLRRLTSQSLSIDSSVITNLSKMNGNDFIQFVAGDLENKEILLEDKFFSFRQDAFARSVHCDVSLLVEELWRNSKLKYVPPHVLNPIFSLTNDVFISLEQSKKETTKEEKSQPPPPFFTRSWRNQRRENAEEGEEANEGSSSQFQLSASTLQRMVDMGFSRERARSAIEASQSNVVEVAMEFALANPPAPETSSQGVENQDRSGSSDTAGTNDEEKDENSETILSAEAMETSSAEDPTSETSKTDVVEKKLSEAERKELSETLFDKETVIFVQDCLKNLKDNIVENAPNVMEGPAHLFGSTATLEKFDKTSETDSEVANVVVCSFLLELCERYPEERSRMVNRLIDCLKSHLDTDAKGVHRVKDGRANQFACACHAIVVFMGALPRARTLVLKQNVLTCIFQCLRAFTSTLKPRHRSQKLWPCWLPQSLLLIDLMSQPMSLEEEGKKSEEGQEPLSGKGDYARVLAEHKRQHTLLTKTSKRISMAFDKNKANNKRLKQKESKKSDEASPDAPKETVLDTASTFAKIPTFSPLITQDMAESFLIICLQIFRYQQRKADVAEKDAFYIPPNTAHALLLALTKILRFQKVGSLCLRMGGAELLLSLQRKSRFNGHIPLVTLALRRIMEDEHTLQTIMESEIRSTVTKLLKKKKKRGSNSESELLSTRSFVENISPSICRDPVIFLKAAATSIKVVPDESNPNKFITLLPLDEKLRNAKALADYFRSNSQNHLSSPASNQKSSTTGTPTTKRGRQEKQKHNIKSGKSKSPHRGSRKAHKKEKQDRFITVLGSPANHVTSQILTVLMKNYNSDEIKVNNLPFLSLIEYLEIIGDLMLAIPACAGAIHSYQLSSKNIKIRHALSGCVSPTKSVVNFLLHELLPQPRVAPAKQHDHDISKTLDNDMMKLYMKTRTSQCAARVLVILVARAGEGRRRVLSELASALRVDKGVGTKSAEGDSDSIDREMWALNTWGELCMGLAAPRRINPSHDTESTLSLEVVKVMQECGMTHAIMRSFERIKLEHPLAATTAAALLRPLENFTRPTVIDAIELMAKKAEKKKILSKIDDSMLTDGFDADEGGRNDLWSYANEDAAMEETDEASDEEVDMESSFDEMDDDSIMMSEDDSDDDSDDDDSDDSESDEDNDSDDSDEEISSSHNTDDSNEDMIDNDGNAIDDDDVVDDDDDDQIEIVEHDDFAIHGETDDDFFEGNEDVEDEAEGNMQIDGDFDGDWTAIESGLGNSWSRSGAPVIGRPRTNVGGGGALMIEAAENVIGNILRSGGIHRDYLHEIEDTLGIRIGPPIEPFSGTRSREAAASNRNRSIVNSNQTFSLQNQGPMGPIPTINQRGPPDNYFSSIGGTARIGELNFMEYQFGGPPLGPNRMHYNVLSGDLTAENRQPSDELLHVPPSFDVQLFPYGSAASTFSRPQSISHPLVAGVNLPPANALMSVTNRNGDETRRSRRSSDSGERNWTEIHLDRGTMTGGRGPVAGINIFERTSSNVSASNFRQAVDPVSSQFSLAFEQALATTVMNSSTNQSSSETNNSSNNQTGPDQSGESGGRNEGSNISVDGLNGQSGQVEAVVNSNGANEDSNVSESENVASLAASLTLSNNDTEQNDNVTNSEQHSNTSNTEQMNNTMNSEQNNVESSSEQMNIATNSEQNDDTVNTEQINNTTNIEQNNTSSNAEQSSDEQMNAQNETVTDNEQSNPSVDNDVSENNGQSNASNEQSAPVCPPGMDIEVFSQLPLDMQQEIIAEHQRTETVAAQLDATSGLDPEALAALPEDMRREVIAEEQNSRRLRAQENAPADPSNAEEMDNASFIASLAPELRRDVLLSADDAVLNSLPPDIVAEAQLLRDRSRTRHRRDVPIERNDHPARRQLNNASNENAQQSSQQRLPAKKRKTGKKTVDKDRISITYKPVNCEKDYGPLVTSSSLKALLSLMYLLSPVRPQKLIHRFFQNMVVNPDLRHVVTKTLMALLNNDPAYALTVMNSIDGSSINEQKSDIGPCNSFPPSRLLGTAPDIEDNKSTNTDLTFFRRRRSPAIAIATNLPVGARCSASDEMVPPVVSRRLVGTLTFLTKNGSRTALDILDNFGVENMEMNCMNNLLGLLAKDAYAQSSSNLEDLLALIDSVSASLSSIPLNDDCDEVTKKEIDAVAASGKELVDVPRTVVSPEKLHLLCMTLRLECCKDAILLRVNSIARRLCKVIANRDCILRELASVAQVLGVDAIRDLRALRIRLNNAVDKHRELLDLRADSGVPSIPSTAVTLSTSTSEVKLLNVLRTMHSLCAVVKDEQNSKKGDGHSVVREELVALLQSIDLASVWEQLTACLRVVSILEGVSNDAEEKESDPQQEDNIENNEGGKKLQNSVAGLLSRFLPTIEAFFVVNASTIDTPNNEKESPSEEDDDIHKLVGGQELINFVTVNKILINAILRSSPSHLDKGLRAMVRIPQCRPFMDFDVKRQWFRTQVGRLRKHAIRRHGSLRLTIRRQYVFQDTFYQIRKRKADEMRGRLHITFVNEEGVDAGGLSREFFGILAKEIFNPNYALFTSTEDGCTFQPNSHSGINSEHLEYFRFVGRIVGKALADGFLLDAHFTRSLYKHMIGMKPTYHDMQAIDPDYYKNLKAILEYNLEDIGLELSFSTEVHSFGKSQIIDLIPNGRNIKVTEKNKEEYVSLVCQHRMTTAIQEQIKHYLEGFYELVKPDLISIFTAKELELLISGMPDIDIDDLKKNTDYQGYRATDKEIGWFWNIMFSLNKSEKAAFLQFTTGSSKVPLNGFAELQGMRGIQKFSINKVGGGANGALMSAHTCFNSLDLPVYTSEEIMKDKLLLSIKEGAGAFLCS